MKCKDELCLTPIPCKLPPPKNTQIQVRCFTCTKFDVCKIKEDYLKTALLISKVLGAPAENFDLHWIPNFYGTDIYKPLKYFPAYIKVDDTVRTFCCSFLGARFTDINTISFVYGTDDIMIQFKTIFTEDGWQFFMGEEVATNAPYYIASEDTKRINDGLLKFQEDLRNSKPPLDSDIIDTTAFSARLECDFYEPIKNLSYCDGMRRIAEKYPHGVPIGHHRFYHIATYHVEPYEVPLYHYYNGTTAYMPMPYPVPVPPKCEKKQHCKTHRRDDNGKVQ